MCIKPPYLHPYAHGCKFSSHLGGLATVQLSHVELHCYTLVLLVLFVSNEFKGVTASVVGVPYTFAELQARAYDLGIVIGEHMEF